ncbi:PREDICTED: uncharacterized protein LOC108379916, partial [Rhagoletis zephyria]|uniref:uncharacterized protein LOC108379916 n=1 Tax=Rhagoletis zephyria TaxID=28612 RepID=UPI000811435F
MNRKKFRSESEQIVNLLFESKSDDEHPECEALLGEEEPHDRPGCSRTFDEPDEFSISSSEDDTDDCINANNDLRKDLTEWTVKHNITYAAIDDLLKILSKRITGLPLCARTLKNTPKSAPKVIMGSGEYVHYGVESALTDFLCRTDFSGNCLNLNINIDGLPLAKSSNTQI